MSTALTCSSVSAPPRRNYLATAAGIDRKNGNIPYLLGVTFVEKQPDKALGYLRTADRLRPKHGPTLLSMGEDIAQPPARRHQR